LKTFAILGIVFNEMKTIDNQQPLPNNQLMEVTRAKYLDTLLRLKDTNLIKVIVGVRRSGKSVLLNQFARKLTDSGVPSSNILSVNFEELEYEELLDYRTLNRYVLERLAPGKNYVFFDEIQRVQDYEKVVDSLFAKRDIELYITGSNADFLASELSTLLTGRYIEIKMFPYSFAEYVSAHGSGSAVTRDLFNEYLFWGGMPEAVGLQISGNQDIVPEYLRGVFATIKDNDIIRRFAITNVELLNNLARFLAGNIGSIASPRSITNYIKSEQQAPAYNTVAKYLQALSSSLLFIDVKRQDIRGKRLLRTQQKTYLVDPGFRVALLEPSRSVDVGHLLENIVYLELLRRGYEVYVGKADDAEIDFVVHDFRKSETTYIQVAYSVADASTLKRELAAFARIRDASPRLLLTLDDIENNHDGIKQRNVIKWLLEETPT
jgi:predicted AAA+ superfamily ATPase